jgi:hypothetical protein
MTKRKPPSLTWESWTEQQIREAQDEGQFDDLPGAGKPLPGLTGVHDPLWWVKSLVRRERLSDLPPAMEIRVRVEQELEKIWKVPGEAAVRAKVAALNAEIAKVNRTTTSGPPTSLGLLDVDAVVERWRRKQ